MSEIFLLERALYLKALEKWEFNCRRAFFIKYPDITFDSDYWPFKTIYKIRQKDWRFTVSVSEFINKDDSFLRVLKCLISEIVIFNTRKDIDNFVRSYRLLATLNVASIFDIQLSDLRKLEEEGLQRVRLSKSSGGVVECDLTVLQKLIETLAEKGIIPHCGFRIRSETKSQLTLLIKSHRQNFKNDRASLLDLKIDALSDAVQALVNQDERLDKSDRVAISCVLRLMCAPSRINEILCASIDDYVSPIDYMPKGDTLKTEELGKVHQMLLIPMKGSKGAQWSAKPGLTFMIEAFNSTTKIIKEAGVKSRMLINWYANNPDDLYIPKELEYLRGQDLTPQDIATLMSLSSDDKSTICAAHNLFKKLAHKQFAGANPHTFNRLGNLRRKMVRLVPYADVETAMLRKIQQAIAACPHVTLSNSYQGDLSKMLFLYDHAETPYIPGVFTYKFMARRLKNHDGASKYRRPTVFEKLGITMPVDGKIEYASIETHDPRRWLTTQALRHGGENISDVVINKWANRKSLNQLDAYDFRTREELAESSSISLVGELVDITKGIHQAKTIQQEFGLDAGFITAMNANVSLVSMDTVMQAVDDRPVARSSDQIIILYPSQFGICLHQHHETPCRNYDSCLPCDNNVVVKGHLPTNESIRKRADLLHKSVIRQLERLVLAYERNLADEQDVFAAHIELLVRKGLNSEQLATSLINEFIEIKECLKDKLLAKRLEEAFVSYGFVKRLDDDAVQSGALIKYNNANYHSSPGMERALLR